MTPKKAEILAASIVVILLLLSLEAWSTNRKQQSQLSNTIADQEKLINEVKSRETEREHSLDKLLTEIARTKERTRTPSQILRELPKYLSLPRSIILRRSSEKDSSAQNEKLVMPLPSLSNSVKSTASSDSALDPSSNEVVPNTIPAKIELPTQDLKPLFDYTQDCRACDAKLRAAQDDIADGRAKLAAMTKERDTAMNAAKGGGVWQRLRSHLRWLAAGAAIGFWVGYSKE